MRRSLIVFALTAMVAACGGGSSSSTAPTQGTAPAPTLGAAATPRATPQTTAIAITNPPATPIPGCLPQCWTGRLTRPGALSGVYKTKNFFGGNLIVTVPDGWASREDSTGEFALGRPNDETASMEFWIDLFAAKNATGGKDDSVGMDADSMIDWFVGKKIIKVIDRSSTTLVGMPAVRIEYRRNAKAATEDPGCPTFIQPCSVAFSYPEWDGAFGEGGPFHSQLIVADAMWGGQRHAIYVMFWADETSYPQLIDQVNAVIASVKLPNGVTPAS